MSAVALHSPAVITPGLSIKDTATAYWIGQVNLRLRREICWCWYQRAQQLDDQTGVLPPLDDAASESLDKIRIADLKHAFFVEDTTARYLSAQIEELPHPEDNPPARGSWPWVVKTLALDRAAQFVLALGVAARLDSALAPVFANCMNDLTRPHASLALAQRLWDEPDAILQCADANHSLYRTGLLAIEKRPTGGLDWLQPLEVPIRVVRKLAAGDDATLEVASPEAMDDRKTLDGRARILVARLRSGPEEPTVIPLLGAPGTAYDAWAEALGRAVGRSLVAAPVVADVSELRALATDCWLQGVDILLPDHIATDPSRLQSLFDSIFVQAAPVRWYLPITRRADIDLVPAHMRAPPLEIPCIGVPARAKFLEKRLDGMSGLGGRVIVDCARRFRYEERTLARIVDTLKSHSKRLDAAVLYNACQAEVPIDLGNLAQPVVPRFSPDDLVLPAQQKQQFDELVHATRTLTNVHYKWGTAQLWNECGISALFSGSPGTGKTMAAEALAGVLELPMYRIDLSQVVNKYIGETEKNLHNIFAAAEASDCLLFFDEADALFGKRTDVRDAHDRFANIEISYLLEKMERFKGLAILATNRRKDLDEAFTRRLHYVIEFPLPGPQERGQIWRAVFPQRVNTSSLDFDFLASQFSLAGGHIRSIAFNACLLAADAEGERRRPRVKMKDVLVSVKRELDKLERTADASIFGPYESVIKGLIAE